MRKSRLFSEINIDSLRIENRMRFALEIFEAIQSELPTGFPVGIRISATDWIDGGWDPEPGYQLLFAEAIKKEVMTPVIGVGLITEPEQVEKALEEGKADLIAIGRNMLYNPRWGWHAATALGEQTTAPSQYLRCQPHRHKDLFRK